MHAIILGSACVLAFVLAAVQPVLGQVPRPPAKEVVLQTRDFPIPFPGYNQAYVNLIAFSKDATLLATGAESNIIVWDVETQKIVTRMQLGDKQYAINLAFTDDGKTLVSNGHDDPMIRFWDVKSGRQKGERPHTNAPKEPLSPGPKGERNYRNPFIAFGPGGKTMAVYDAGFNRIDIADTATGQIQSKPDKSGSSWRGSWALSGDGKRIGTGSQWQWAIDIWDAETGEHLRNMEAKLGNKKNGGYTNLRFSHDGKYVFAYASGSGANDHHIAIWGVEDGLEYCRIPVWCYHLEMSTDGRMVVGAAGGRFFVFDLLADKLIENIKLPAPYFYHVQRSPDALTLAFLGGSGNVKGESAVYLAPYPLLGDDAIPKERLSAADERDLWTGLSSSNLFRRRYATKVFSSHAEQSVALVDAKVKPAPAAARQRVADLIKQLDDDDFERRDAATKALAAEAFRFEPLLRDTIKSSSAGEIRNRLTFVLNGIKDQPPPAELLAELRGVELLEALATSPARKLLESLANGAAGARTTVEAEGALRRIEK